MLDRINETIVAVSSAPGHGPVGIIRLSGPESLSLAGAIATLPNGEDLTQRRGSTRIAGEMCLGDELGLPAVFYVFRAPRSYTRQDSVEIHTIGAPALTEMVRKILIEKGAIPADPGEFTARAFLNGGMDLASAEAVSGIIRAGTDTQLRASRRMLEGRLGRDIAELRTVLAELVGLVEADIDFAEEPIEFVTPEDARERMESIRGGLRSLIEDSCSAEQFDVLPHILLLGRPNVGKSTLMNRLSGTSRAICAAAAGTTRDILCAPVQLGRSEAILLDSAGIDQDDDEIIAQARAMAMSTDQNEDLICLVVELSD